MRVSWQGLELIRTFEGFSAVPYLCPAGYATIGYGHVVLAHEVWDRPIDEARGMQLLEKDAQAAEVAVRRLLPNVTAQNGFDALVSFTFNLGAAALQRSQLRQAILRGETEAIAKQWLRWVYAKGRILPGLVRRRQAELALYTQRDFTELS